MSETPEVESNREEIPQSSPDITLIKKKMTFAVTACIGLFFGTGVLLENARRTQELTKVVTGLSLYDPTLSKTPIAIRCTPDPTSTPQGFVDSNGILKETNCHLDAGRLREWMLSEERKAQEFREWLNGQEFVTAEDGSKEKEVTLSEYIEAVTAEEE